MRDDPRRWDEPDPELERHLVHFVEGKNSQCKTENQVLSEKIKKLEQRVDVLQRQHLNLEESIAGLQAIIKHIQNDGKKYQNEFEASSEFANEICQPPDTQLITTSIENTKIVDERVVQRGAGKSTGEQPDDPDFEAGNDNEELSPDAHVEHDQGSNQNLLFDRDSLNTKKNSVTVVVSELSPESNHKSLSEINMGGSLSVVPSHADRLDGKSSSPEESALQGSSQEQECTLPEEEEVELMQRFFLQVRKDCQSEELHRQQQKGREIERKRKGTHSSVGDMLSLALQVKDTIEEGKKSAMHEAVSQDLNTLKAPLDAEVELVLDFFKQVKEDSKFPSVVDVEHGELESKRKRTRTSPIHDELSVLAMAQKFYYSHELSMAQAASQVNEMARCKGRLGTAEPLTPVTLNNKVRSLMKGLRGMTHSDLRQFRWSTLSQVEDQDYDIVCARLNELIVKYKLPDRYGAYLNIKMMMSTRPPW